VTSSVRQAPLDSESSPACGLTWVVRGDGAVAARVRTLISERGGLGPGTFEPGWDYVADEAAILVAETVRAASGLLEELGPPGERPPIVFVCEKVRPGEIRSALAADVSGLVVAADLELTLGPCLGAVESGQICVPRSQARQVEAAALSTREKQILGLVVMGLMNGEIASRLFVAESTVKSHLSSAFSKLGVRSRYEAVELILDPERGLGTGILGLGVEHVGPAPPEAS
jgi:DNA-binding CsgD family transcriptional regulator